MAIALSNTDLTFLKELKVQRWDDHRYYHHNRVNQALHLFSACCFLIAYALLFLFPVVAAGVGWILAMISRQVGHFFFEPKDFDSANDVSHEFKESVKVGYNLRRKVVLLSIWAFSPVILLLDPDLFGLLDRHVSRTQYIINLAEIWLLLGICAVLFRTVQLFFIESVQTGLVWLTKILTDPIHDIILYHKAPWHVLQGELYDPIVVTLANEPALNTEAQSVSKQF